MLHEGFEICQHQGAMRRRARAGAADRTLRLAVHASTVPASVELL